MLSAEFDDFLLTPHPDDETGTAGSESRMQAEHREQFYEANFTPMKLLSSLLSRDRSFASNIIGHKAMPVPAIVLISAELAMLLDEQ